MSETLDWHPKIEEELMRLNLVKPANPENKYKQSRTLPEPP